MYLKPNPYLIQNKGAYYTMSHYVRKCIKLPHKPYFSTPLKAIKKQYMAHSNELMHL